MSHRGAELHVALSGSGDRAAQIYARLREAILDGRLDGGDRVPASRDLAATLGVARGTVTAAYDRLVAEEFLVSRRGAGTFVVQGCSLAAGANATRPARTARHGAVRPTAVWQRETPPARGPDGAAYDFSLGVPDTTLFPYATWRRLVTAHLRAGRVDHGTYETSGHPGLQAEIARYAGLSRSVVASGDDVVVTAGAQQALDLVARVVLDPGAVVAVEDPGYEAAHRLLETHRAVVHPVPVDDEGLVVDALPAGTRLVHVTPSHQFPTGVTMSRARRTALLDWAVRHDALVVEDDYDSEFRFADRPLEPLQSLDRDGRVVYIGSFSKSLLPALRIGYAIAPVSLQPALREARRVTVWNGDATTQSALADFLAEGHHAAHVRRASKVYRERRDELVGRLESQLDPWLRVVPSAAGLHVTTLLRDPEVSDVVVAEAAERAGVFVDTLSSRHRGPDPRHGLAFGLGGVPVHDIGPAIELLRGSLANALRPGRRRRPSDG
ncbi:GntR family transcriptional regulator [Humibacillus xanthopallidus]|uniref:GntR family transcriptional regulator n=1 Tax=Humibacillus xanthopallidus TaxID=412689 RepID=A0A543PP26_9MICO|nr:PLP-dependent aminotransferase family protein [Humibacillus xanthopallidus]TQN45820.1 GntR family transcriptional regulator [Humibacillus xanthopallidus]